MAMVLVVDDDALIRRCIERNLRREGHEVVMAAHGGEALRLAGERSFDVALVDYQLPLLDGLEVLSRLREMQPGCLRVLVTGRLDLPLVIGAVNRGEITRVVEKPFTSQALAAAVSESLTACRRYVEVVRVQQEVASERERSMLADCLSDSSIRLAIQPIVDAGDGTIVAFEGLLRSEHRVLNGPLPILKAAERHNMVGDVAAVVASRAAGWLARIPAPVMLFLNLHPDELADPGAIAGRLVQLEPWASRVVLEITERSKLQGIEHWEDTVNRLTDMGFALAIDDLGAGYSSLAVLAELHPKYIKVDMSIVRGVDSEPRKRRLVDLLCRFSDATDALLVAEGVETEAEAEALRECGAHLLQGYLLGRPSFELPQALRIAG